MADMKAIMQQLSMQEQYDENAKWLNSQKPFLANILIRTVDDFKGMQPEEVVKLIEGEPSVGRKCIMKVLLILTFCFMSEPKMNWQRLL